MPDPNPLRDPETRERLLAALDLGQVEHIGDEVVIRLSERGARDLAGACEDTRWEETRALAAAIGTAFLYRDKGPWTRATAIAALELIGELEARFERYARHDGGCDYRWSGTCSCGLLEPPR